MIDPRYDTQLLIEGENLDEDAIREYIIQNFEGDSSVLAGDEELIKLHFHTNTPMKNKKLDPRVYFYYSW